MRTRSSVIPSGALPNVFTVIGGTDERNVVSLVATKVKRSAASLIIS